MDCDGEEMEEADVPMRRSPKSHLQKAGELCFILGASGEFVAVKASVLQVSWRDPCSYTHGMAQLHY